MHRLHDVTDDVNLEHLGEVELVKFLNRTGTLLPILLVCPCVCVCLCVHARCVYCFNTAWHYRMFQAHLDCCLP